MKLVGVICGGFSSEYEISLKSGKNIVDNFPEEYKAVKIVYSRSECRVDWDGERLPVNLNHLTFATKDGVKKIDYAIVFIHGNPGENGKLQALFDMHKVRYINSGALASELSFDKWYCNQFVQNFGVKVAASKLLLRGESVDEKAIIDEIGLPLFVKPCDSGSSYGISKVKEKSKLKPAIEDAFREGNSVVIESFLDGTEVTCGVYRKSNGLHALPLVEIETENEFFDYEAKYLGNSKEIVPARISEELTQKIQAISKKIYAILGFKSIARIDFMLVDGEPYMIEANTTPGFTDESIVPKMIAADNKSIKEFWREIMEEEIREIGDVRYEI